jgi:hypothetical protein
MAIPLSRDGHVPELGTDPHEWANQIVYLPL